MPVDHIRYDLLTQDALREVIRRVLADAAVKGLPGEHHFFITFDTRAEGVRMSARLKSSYPQDMTIVLQHQFWDLIVGEDDFEVGLAFNGIPERLYVPLKAVKGFVDPSVQFGLQFAVDAEPGGVSVDTGNGTAKNAKAAGKEPTAPPAEPMPPLADTRGAVLARRPKLAPEPAASARLPAETRAAKPPDDAAAAKDAAAGQVVRLDRFRKK
jgi:uncharacterized protein